MPTDIKFQYVNDSKGLRTIDPGTTKSAVFVRGVADSNDNRPAIYYWDEASIAPDDSDYIIKVTGRPQGRWTRTDLRAEQAMWTGLRYYAIDNADGDDQNAGFSDTSLTAAGAVAVKTAEQLVKILPPLGTKAQSVEIVFKTSTANYTDLQLYLGGYGSIVVRSSAAFAGDADDELLLGAEIALTGPNGNGSWTVDAGASVSSIPIKTGTIATDRTPQGYRVRFATGALAGELNGIYDNTASAITTNDDLSGVPADGDTFFIERPGVSLGIIQVNMGGGGSLGNGDFSIAGLEARTELNVMGRTPLGRVTFMNVATGAAAVRFDGNEGIIFSKTWANAAGTQRDSGVGLRKKTTGVAIIQRQNALVLSDSSIEGITITLLIDGTITTARSTLLRGTTLGIIATLGHPDQKAAGFFSQANVLGNKGSATRRRLRLSGSVFTCQTGNLGLYGVQLEDTAGVAVRGTGAIVTVDDFVHTGTIAATALDLSLAFDTKVVAGSQATNTAAGSSNEILLAGALTKDWADIATEGFVDVQGNEIAGAVKAVTRITDGTMGNVPVLAADPSAPADGDMWLKDTGGTRTLHARISGVTYSTTLTV